jgi:hypothetical protein
MSFDLRARTILLTVAGSRAYGIHTARSDVDVKGVAIPPRPYFLGYLHRFEQADSIDEIQVFMPDLSGAERDICARTKLEGSVYSLVKFCRLAADCNPNILDVLFCREEEVRLCTPLGRRLREHARLFLSARARHTFSGYAASQLKRIKGHRRWLLHPPQHKPTRADYDLPERTLIPADQLAAAASAIRTKMDSWAVDFGSLAPSSVIDIQGQIASYLTDILSTTDSEWKCAARGIGYSENFIALLDRERRYKSALREWQQYQSWKRHRNPDRASIEAAFGYDAKHGAHLIRLLRMGREIMADGEVNVWRGEIDAGELQSIRAGEWSYARLVAEAERIDGEIRSLHRSGDHKLPPQPDRDAIDALLVSLVEDALQASG